MKLYTEEQVKESLMKHQDSSMFLSVDQIDYLISEITPIELPTDEEIGKGCDENIPLDEEDMWSERLYFRIGAKWYREQLKKK